MSALLEVENPVPFRGASHASAAARGRAAGPRRELHARARRDAGAGRRVGLRQVDREPPGAAADRADRRPRPLRGTRRAGARRRRIAGFSPQGAAGVSGSLRLAQPAHDGGPDPGRAAGAAHPAAVRAAGRARGRAARPGRPRVGGGTALSARILRRPAPARRDRARARGRAQARHLRRAGVGARRLDPLADPQPAARSAAPPRARLHLHLARPRW